MSGNKKPKAVKGVTFGTTRTAIIPSDKLSKRRMKEKHGQCTNAGKRAECQEIYDQHMFAKNGVVTGEPPSGQEIHAELMGLAQEYPGNEKGRGDQRKWGGRKTQKKKSNKKAKRNTRRSSTKQNKKGKKSKKTKTVKRRRTN